MESAENQHANADHREDRQKVVDIIDDIKIGMFSTLDEDNVIVSRPLVALEIDADADLWFVTHESTSQVTHIARDDRVNVTFTSRSEWASLTGRGEVVRDVAKTRDLWNQMVDAWFPDGPETPGVVLIRVEADSAQYWDTPGGPVVAAFKWVKSRLGDDRIDAGESHRVDL